MNKKLKVRYRSMFKQYVALLLSFMFIPVITFADVLHIKFAYVGPEDHSALLGVQQGLEEANLQGQFLNQKYELDIVPENQSDTYDFSDYLAILTVTNIDTFKKLTENTPDKPIFNLVLDNDALRTSCINNALHIIPGNKMIKDAELQWRKKNPDSKAVAQAWHPDFVKFAARDLNKRFKKTHDVEMNDYAWAGWAAVKLTSDTVARTKLISSREILNYLKSKLIFDGQKGADMSFRKTGQLRQPLLLVESDKILAEAPVRGIAKPPTLDSIGELNCEK